MISMYLWLPVVLVPVCLGRCRLLQQGVIEVFPLQPPQDLSREEREVTSPGRRFSAGDVLDNKFPVKHKPPPSPHSRSTSTSPLLDRGRKTEGGGVTKRNASPLGTTRTTRREASPTSSGESEASSTTSTSETSTPSSTAKACTVGEKVSEDHVIMLLGVGDHVIMLLGVGDHVIMV